MKAILTFVCLMMNLSIDLRAEAGNEDFSARFYRPGPLQKYVLSQNQSPKKVDVPEATTESGSKGGLSLDSPDLGTTTKSSDTGSSVGVFSNVVFGGTLDYRFLVPKDMLEGMFMIHVNELFLTTNIGDNVSILAEQLLLTSDLGTTVGQDHGFAYATISNLSFLPEGTALRIGRFRVKYGIDAKLDGPANPLRTPEYRTIGVLSDRALEIAGYFGFLEYVAAVSMGADFVLKDVRAVDGSVAGPIKVDANNHSRPFAARLGTDFKKKRPNFGVSIYAGNNYRVTANSGFQASDIMIFGGLMDQHELVYKERLSLDGRWDIWKLRFSGEYTLGRDTDGGNRYTVSSYYLRSDITIVPQSLTAQIQYDYFADGRAQSDGVGSIGLGLTYFLTDQSWLRGFFQGTDTLFGGKGASWLSGTQLLLAF